MTVRVVRATVSAFLVVCVDVPGEFHAEDQGDVTFVPDKPYGFSAPNVLITFSDGNGVDRDDLSYASTTRGQPTNRERLQADALEQLPDELRDILKGNKAWH